MMASGRLTSITGAILLLGSAACASSTPQAATWPNDDKKGNDELPAIVPHGDSDEDLEQSGEPGRLREPTTVAVPVAGTDLVRGRSTVIVNAPIDVVRKTVIDFGKYADFMPHYSAARVLRRKKDGTREVYMQWAALHGAIKLHARVEMVPRHDGDTEVWQSRYIDGNVDEAQASWTLTTLSPDRTKLTLDAFLLPKLPMPSSLLNSENTSGAEKGVVAMRKRCEQIAAARAK